MKRYIAFVALFFAPIAAHAQTGAAAPPAQVVVPPGDDDEGGLTGSVTDESAWQDLGIAIPSFATDANVATPANSEGTAALGQELARSGRTACRAPPIRRSRPRPGAPGRRAAPKCWCRAMSVRGPTGG